MNYRYNINFSRKFYPRVVVKNFNNSQVWDGVKQALPYVATAAAVPAIAYGSYKAGWIPDNVLQTVGLLPGSPDAAVNDISYNSIKNMGWPSTDNLGLISEYRKMQGLTPNEEFYLHLR